MTWRTTPLSPGSHAWRAALAFATAVALVTPASSAQAAFPGSNGKLAFQQGESEGFIYTMNGDGTGLSHHWLATGLRPAWSPDGRKLAFARHDPWNLSGDLEIWTMNADGSGARQLTANAVDDDFPAWSADGTKIVFRRTDRQTGLVADLYVMGADGTGEAPLVDSPGIDGWPSWSPDGTTIGFSSNRTGTFEIYTISPDGTGLRQVTTNAVQDYMGDWSPDGKWIVFHRNDVVLPQRDIWKMRSGGGDERRLTDHPEDDWYPAWSPDGKQIAFATYRDNGTTSEIYTMDADGRSQSNRTPSSISGGFPDWQPVPQDPGAITGKVSDAKTKRAIPGATVDCAAAGSASTGKDGRYSISQVTPGTYTCAANATGYRPASQTVTVTSGTTTTADFALVQQ